MPTIEYLSRRNIRAASLALLLFLYPIVALSFFSVKYIETIHRVSMRQTFDVSLFGSLGADCLASVGLGMLFLALSSRRTVSKIIFAAIFALAVAAFVIDHFALIVGGLVMLPAVAALLITAAIADRTRPLLEGVGKQRLPFDGKRVAGVFLSIVIVVEVGALGRWIAYPFFPSELYSDISWKFAELESALFHSFGLLSPYFVVLLAFSFLYKWYIRDAIKKIWRVIVPSRKYVVDHPNHEKTSVNTESESVKNTGIAPMGSQSAPLLVKRTPTNAVISKHLHHWILALALAIAPLLMIYPHLPGINPDGEGISTDEQYYTRWMTLLRSSGNDNGTGTDILVNAFQVNNGNRPLTLLAILAISNLTGLTDLTVIRYLPVLLAPTLVAANYVLLRHTLNTKPFESNRTRIFAAIGALFATFSPQIVVGEYAGLLANWLALTVAYLAFYLMIRIWESSEQNRLFISVGALFAILLITMLIHLYTWAHLLAVMLLFVGLSFLFSRRTVSHPRVKLILMLAIVLTSFSVDYAKSLYFGTPSAVESDSALASNIQAQDPGRKWDRLYFTLTGYVGGFLSNPVLFLLALVWIARSKMNSLSTLLLSMIFMLSMPVAIGSTEFQTRVLYNTPVHIAAAMAFLWAGGRFGKQNEDKVLMKILVGTTILVLATYALRALANIPLELPNGYELERDFLLS